MPVRPAPLSRATPLYHPTQPQPFRVQFPTAQVSTTKQTLAGVPAKQFSCSSHALQMKVIGAGALADMEGDVTSGNSTGTYYSCLWWGDNFVSASKTYELYRGVGEYNMPLSSMQEIASFSATTTSYGEFAPKGQVCYILLIANGEGTTYQLKDICFSNNY